jgi:hypothetical protein
MIGALAGVILTLLGVHGGRAAVERWKLGPLATLSLGWAMGMAFVFVVVVLAHATEAP